MVKLLPILWNVLALLQTPLVLSSPEKLSPGDVGVVFLWIPQGELQPRVALLNSQNKTLGTFPTFPWANTQGYRGFRVALVGLGPDFLPGTYELKVDLSTVENGNLYKGGISRLEVVPRKFKETILRVTPRMRAAQTTPDPRRQEQSRRLTQVLETFNMQALQNQQNFQLPLKITFRWTSDYGDRRKEIYPRGGNSTVIHHGSDLAAPKGTKVFAPAAGRVVLVEDRILTGWTLILEHLPGVYSMFYHMDSISAQVGMLYRGGDYLGELGSTGFSTGPHLHWEVRVNTQAVDPVALLGGSLIDKERLITIMTQAFLQKRG
ncbi:MAG: hypothetical protein A2Z96_01075 [Spirochaetes bacterium GWB1_48_6]|nr:MAG: hypothetical protein A2Z96_01075 [Spirochaetes bacterium GWB1_48_6]